MKKFIYLFSLLFFFACSSDDDKEVYLDNSLIEGNWYYVQNTDSTIHTFKNNVMTMNIFDRYLHHLKSERSFGSYKLTTTEIITTYQYKETIRRYKLEDNILYIMHSSDGTYTPYTKLE